MYNEKIKKIIISKIYKKWINQAIKTKIIKLRYLFDDYINFRFESALLHEKYIKYDINGNNNSNF